MKKLVLVSLLLAAGAIILYILAPAEDILGSTSFSGMVLDSNDRPMRFGLSGDSKYRMRVSLDEIAPEAVQALLDYEDRFFYNHPGVNPFSLLRACLSLGSARRVGGSTITMQVARLRYGLRTSTVPGKIRQILLALALEARHSKREILEAYFNLAPYGGNIEGIEAASRIYFQKPSSQLTLSESRSLAVVPQNPIARNPARGARFAEGRSRIAGERLLPLAISGPSRLPFVAPHLSLEILEKNPGATSQTTIDSSLQRLIEQSLLNYTSRGRGYGMDNAAAMLVRWTDMQVCALAGSANFHSDRISGQIDGTAARRSPGSTLKPFIYALALDAGLIHPGTILADTPRSFGGYDPENFDRAFRGPVDAGEALRSSRNLPAIFLASQLPQPGLYGFLKSAGVEFQFGEAHYGLSLVLGGAEVSMRELAALYAMLANQGVYRPLRFLRADPCPAGAPLLSPEAAWLTLEMLKRPEAVARSRGADVNLYYKTGTSNGMRDAWTCGIVGEYALVVWIGNFDNSSNPNFVGARAALPLFEELARQLGGRNLLRERLNLPPAALKLVEAEFCANTGDIYAGQCESVEKGWLIAGVSPLRDTQILRRILVDDATGLRSCIRASTPYSEMWWEFWPSDLEQAFEKAGIHKPKPPEWLPECRDATRQGKAPRILLPKRNVTYQRLAGQENFQLPLLAAADADAGMISWYAGKRYLGKARAGETIFWNAPPGRQVITAVDSAGRSARQECVINVAN